MGKDQRYQPSLGEEAIIHSLAVAVVVDVVAEAEDKVVEDDLMDAEEDEGIIRGSIIHMLWQDHITPLCRRREVIHLKNGDH